jgi:hypothetical protein
LASEVTVSFSRGVSASERNTIFLKSKPTIAGILYWSEDNKTLSIKPTTQLPTETSYKVTIRYRSTERTWTFKTTGSTTLSDSEERAIQGAIDFNDGLGLIKNISENPWINQVPIITSSYFVGYNTPKSIFFAHLYPSKTSSVPIDTQVASLKSAVVNALKKVGASPNPNAIEWTISPK